MAALVWVTTSQAVVGVSPDSVVYLDAARHLAAGDGAVFGSNLPGPGPDAGLVPLTHYPPGYPALLALIMRATGATAESAARFSGMGFAFLNVVLVALIALRVAGPVLSLLLAASFAVGIPLQLHIMAWSEPAFLTCTLAALLALAIWSTDRERKRWLVAASLCGALASLLRYPGVVLAGAACIFIIASATPAQRRASVRDAVVVALAMIAPIVWWVLRAAASADATANRRLVLHLIDGERLAQGAATMARFLSPLPRVNEWEHIVWGVAWFALAAWCIRASAGAWKRRGFSLDERMLPALYIVGYVAFVVVSISLLDYATPMDSRILAPVIVPLWWTALLLAGWLGRQTWGARRVAAGALLCGIPAGALVRGQEVLAGQARLQYTAPEYRASAIWSCLGGLAASPTIISNKPELIHFRLGRQAVEVPSRWNPYTREANPNFSADSARVDLLLREGAVLALFPPERDIHEPLEALRRRASVVRLYVDGVGEVWRAPCQLSTTCTCSSSSTPASPGA